MSRLPAFEQVVAEHGPAVWRFAASQVGRGRADDVFQDTMVAALSAYPTLRDPSALRSWLLRIAARKAVDLFRATDRATRPVQELDPEESTDPESADEDLWARVRRLPDKQRQAVGLRFVADLDYRDIGVAMDTSAAAARRNVFEAIRTLRASSPSPTPRSHAPGPPHRLITRSFPI